MKPPLFRSLIATTLAMMALRVGLVVVVIGLLAHFFLAATLERTVRGQLEQYVAERVRAESHWFGFMANELRLFRDAYLVRERTARPRAGEGFFERYFERHPDGATRPRRVLYEGTTLPSGDRVAHLSGVIERYEALDAAARRRLFLAVDLLADFGPALVPPAGPARQGFRRPVVDLYWIGPEGTVMVYLPGTRWDVDFRAGYDIRDKEYYTAALPTANPTRAIRWTGTYYDEGMRRSIVSCLLPIDLGGKHVGAVGADIELGRLVQGLEERRWPGTKNLVFREDGRLIAHPDLAAALERREEPFMMARDGDVALADLYRQVVASGRSGVIDDDVHQRLLGVGRLEGTGWYLVTVYPRQLLNAQADRLAGVVLAFGALSLLLEVLILWQVLRRQIAAPLHRFEAATAAVAAGELSPVAAAGLPVERPDEIGGLARAFARMTERLREARATLEDRVRHRTALLEEEIGARERAQRKLEERSHELEVANRRLRELDLLKSNFVNSVTHELRTPLTAIQGYAEFLEDEIGGTLTGDQRGFVGEIGTGAKRLERLLNDLLDFARMDAGTFSLRLEPDDLGARAAEAVTALQPLAHAAGVTLEVVRPAEPAAARLDPQRIGQVLTNLIGNAIKFSPRGGRVRVVVRRDQGRLRCEVEDDGPGIAPGDTARLFQRFSQLEHGVRQGKGAGLGLSIAKALVEAHGGAIGVDARPEGGSAFWFTLPALAPGASPRQEEAPPS